MRGTEDPFKALGATTAIAYPFKGKHGLQMMIATWQTDWEKFVAHVAALHLAGQGDASISAALGAKQVRWQGVIIRLGFDRRYARGPQLQMPEVRCQLRNGKVLVANHAAISADAADEANWRHVGPGDTVEFVATLEEDIGLFPGIRVSYDHEGDEATLMVSLNHGRLCEQPADPSRDDLVKS